MSWSCWRVKAARTPCWPAPRVKGLVCFFTGGIKLQETPEEGHWVMEKRSPACRRQVGGFTVGSGGDLCWQMGGGCWWLDSSGRWLVWGWAVKSLEMDRSVWHERGGVMERRVMWLCCHARKWAQAALRRHPNSKPQTLKPNRLLKSPKLILVWTRKIIPFNLNTANEYPAASISSGQLTSELGTWAHPGSPLMRLRCHNCFVIP